MLLRLAVPLTALVLCAASSGLTASPDWPQWGGPHRNFSLPEAVLPDTFGPDGPARRWLRPIGDGFSAVVTSGTQGFTAAREGERDVVLAFDLASGRTLWEQRFEAPFAERCTERLGPAPRATPLVAGDKVFAASAGGLLTAFDRHTGTVVWQVDLFEGSSAHVRPCGYASSPLAHNGSVLALTGVPGRSVVALRQQDGAVLWGRHDFPNGYSSPLVARIAAREQLVALMGSDLISLDPDTGDLLWQHPHATFSDVNVAMPVVGTDGLVLVSSAYDGGARVLRVVREGTAIAASQVWHNRRLRVHFSPIVRIGDIAIGASGDTAVVLLTAVDVATGSVVWRTRSVGQASMIAVGKRLLVLTEDGELLLATPNRDGLTVDDRAKVLDGTAWTPPTLAGRLVIVRNRSTMAAFDLPPADATVRGAGTSIPAAARLPPRR